MKKLTPMTFKTNSFVYAMLYLTLPSGSLKVKPAGERLKEKGGKTKMSGGSF